jgi:hypothetical protein
MEVSMYTKKGKSSHKSNSGNPILENPEGQAYEVSFITAFVWERLDGLTPMKAITEEISKLADVSIRKLEKSIKLILSELQKFGLASYLDKGAKLPVSV